MSDLVSGARLPEGMTKQEMFVHLNVNVQVAHARAVEVIKRVDPQAQVGGMIGHAPFYPLTCKADDILAADISSLKLSIVLYPIAFIAMSIAPGKAAANCLVNRCNLKVPSDAISL